MVKFLNIILILLQENILLYTGIGLIAIGWGMIEEWHNAPDEKESES